MTAPLLADAHVVVDHSGCAGVAQVDAIMDVDRGGHTDDGVGDERVSGRQLQDDRAPLTDTLDAAAKILNGGRAKWVAEGRELTLTEPTYAPTDYVAQPRNDSPIRAFRDDVLAHLQHKGPLVDVRSPGEYRGELLHMADYPQEGALRGGHIPGAHSVPWARAANSDGTFKSAAELRAIYEEEKGLHATDPIIAYCRIGERSSHTWFVLTYLLGYPNVRNYDGSWTEWGNGVRLPVEK